MIGNIVLLTGATDYLSDGNRVIAVKNGHELLSRATGVSFFPFPIARKKRLTEICRPAAQSVPSAAPT